MRITARIREPKTKLPRAPFQPPKGPGFGEILVESGVSGAAEIQCPAGVMFAASGCGDELQDRREGLALVEPQANDSGLAGAAAVARERKQLDPAPGGGGGHALPGHRRPGCEAHGLAIICGRTDMHEAPG